MDEFDLIKHYFSPLATSPDALCLADDAAIITPPANSELICTTDTLCEDVHFFKNDDPFFLAQKLLAVNLSDLAAMGAQPLGYFLNLTLPHDTSNTWLSSFSSGLAHSIKTYGGSLLGGDTTSHRGALCMSLTALGTTPKGAALRRTGANVGDSIYVSGTIGTATMALAYLKQPSLFSFDSDVEKQTFLATYYTPTPRLSLGQTLRFIASSCIDISDGLVADLTHLCRTSNVGATLRADSLPLHPVALRNSFDLATLISGGDDYELLFTVSPDNEKRLISMPTTITKIGQITSAPDIIIFDENGRPLPFNKRGYTHHLPNLHDQSDA